MNPDALFVKACSNYINGIEQYLADAMSSTELEYGIHERAYNRQHPRSSTGARTPSNVYNLRPSYDLYRLVLVLFIT